MKEKEKYIHICEEDFFIFIKLSIYNIFQSKLKCIYIHENIHVSECSIGVFYNNLSVVNIYLPVTFKRTSNV